MDSVKWAILTPIFVALITIVAGVVTGIVNAPSPTKPVVTIENSFSDPPTDTAVIKIKNIGGATATNVTVFVKSYTTILDASVSTVLDIVLRKDNKSLPFKSGPITINDTSFELRIPKFVQGDGGLTVINTKTQQQQVAEGLEVTAVYDQGSAVGKEVPFYMKISLPVWIVIITGIGEGLYFLYGIFIGRKKQKVKNLVINFMDIRRKLLDESECRDSFKSGWKPDPFKPYKPSKFDKLLRIDKLNYRIFKGMDKPYHYWNRGVYMTTKHIKNPSDKIKVDDVLDLIVKREELLNSIEIKTRNFELLRSIDNLLNSFDWSKYT